MGGYGKLVRRAAIGALVAGLCTPVAASAATGPAPLAKHRSPAVHVSEKDANKTIHVSPGTRVLVDLHGSYDPPSVDHPEVLSETSHRGGFPSKSDAKATFTALMPGDATITSRLDAACMHPQPGHAQCMIMTAPLNINIVVDGPTAGASVNPPLNGSLTTVLHSTLRRG